MLNESSLIESELRIRSLSIGKEVMETRRSMVRWLALSLGVISPGETRLSAIAVLDAMLHFQFGEKLDPAIPQIIEYISAQWEPINEKTLRYHMLQFKKMQLIDGDKGRYHFIWPEIGERYEPEEWIKNYIQVCANPVVDKAQIVLKTIFKK